jgi:hypothetical protein
MWGSDLFLVKFQELDMLSLVVCCRAEFWELYRAHFHQLFLAEQAQLFLY